MKLTENPDLTPKQMAMAKLIEEKFKNINRAKNKLKVTRQTIYSWVKKGEIPEMTKDVLRGRGWNPETLERIKQDPEE